MTLTRPSSQISSLWRIRSYVRPYRTQILLTTAAAMIGTLVGIAIPLLTKRMIDGPISHHDRGAILPLVRKHFS